MKKIIFTVLLTTILSFLSFGQTDKVDIKKTVEDYFQAMKNNVHENTIEYMHPGIFKYTSKDVILMGLQYKSSNELLTTIIESVDVKGVSDVLEDNGIKYALVKYSIKTIMKYTNKNGEDINAIISMTYDFLKSQYGNENVGYDKDNSIISVSLSEVYMYAVKDPMFQGWKFLRQTDPESETVLEVIPNKVLKNLK